MNSKKKTTSAGKKAAAKKVVAKKAAAKKLPVKGSEFSRNADKITLKGNGSSTENRSRG